MPALQDHIHAQPNRVAQAIYLYAEQDAQLEISSPQAMRSDPQAISLKLDYYRNVYRAYRKKPSAAEKGSLRYLRHEMRKLDAQLHPTMFKRIRYAPIMVRMRNFITGKTLLYREHDNAIKQIRKEHIREHNLHALSEAMKKAGFKFEIEGTLKRMVDQDLPHFHIRYADVQHRHADFVLHFKKMPGTEVYYFEKFDASARLSLDAVLRNDRSGLRQTFSPNGEVSFTAREADSLVQGKSVCKTIHGKETWLVLDGTGINQPGAFRQLSFDLQKALKKLPIKQLDNPAQYKAITEALKMGVNKEVTLLIGGQEHKYQLAASPAQKTIDLLDKDSRLVDLSKIPGAHLPEVTKKLVTRINQQDDVIELFPPGTRKGKRV